MKDIVDLDLSYPSGYLINSIDKKVLDYDSNQSIVNEFQIKFISFEYIQNLNIK